MSREPYSVQTHELFDPELQHRLLAELQALFRDIDDGTVKDNTFTGCVAVGNRSMPPLNETQSKRIKEALPCARVTAHPSKKSGVPILTSVLNLIQGLWRYHELRALPVRVSTESDSVFLDQYGRVRRKNPSSNNDDRKSQVEDQEILETDVKRLLAAKAADYSWATPYAWDIANRLNAVQKSENDGDLALFLGKRRKLNVRRPKSTRFEQSVQRYAAHISELYCDAQGDIIDQESLESFIFALIDALLDKTKHYWPMSPLLAIFDGLVATVIRPLLHEHHTAYLESEVTSSSGVASSGNTAGKIEKLATAPKWNKTSYHLVIRYVEKAFKAQVCFLFLDRYAPYNREYSRSLHVDAENLREAGQITSNFGKPIHLSHVMELIQPTSHADSLVGYVGEHFRSDEFIDH